MQRDTIQGLIQAIESISGGLHRRRQIQRQGRQDAEDAQRRLIHDTYAANQEQRAAESHAERMKGDKDGGVDGLAKALAAIGVGSDKEDSPARETAFKAFLDTGGDPDSALSVVASELAKLKENPITADPELSDPDQREQAKAYSTKTTAHERAMLALRAYVQDRQASGNAPAPTQQDMESRAQTMSLMEAINQMAMSRMQRDQQLQDEYQASAASRQQAAQNKASNYVSTPPRVQPRPLPDGYLQQIQRINGGGGMGGVR